MRENRPYGSEGGESGSTGLPYPYRREVAKRLCGERKASTAWRQVATARGGQAVVWGEKGFHRLAAGGYGGRWLRREVATARGGYGLGTRIVCS